MPDIPGLPGLPDLPDGIGLVAVDMDGTLLDGDGQIPEDLWPLIERLHAHGGWFAPASGRQYATLERQFARAGDGLVYVAENGTYVVRDGVEVSSTTIARPVVSALVERLRALAEQRDVGTVVCGKHAAYVERTDRAFLDHVDPYYASLEVVDDLLAVDDDIIKVAGRDAVSSSPLAAPLEETAPGHQVVVSGQHWLDVMAAGANKGTALRALQADLGVTPAQTVVFGDYLNDLEMLDAAEASFAVANAHEDVRARAAYLAPANTEGGVITVLGALLDQVGG
ncbi:hydrolase [Marmoricola endophyticus]|uniref:Hydrolase n=1 Tax=Marmoricola endophyticus TaxID=2040280 RepID=A0A917BKW0_9ACTN|nr:Cof-type HAD-IIB family hydrolase [Marmoricola endophyticus]GGF48019.1 hydrolase [Marmoricola endophyticus]